MIVLSFIASDSSIPMQLLTADYAGAQTAVNSQFPKATPAFHYTPSPVAGADPDIEFAAQVRTWAWSVNAFPPGSLAAVDCASYTNVSFTCVAVGSATL